ncbi:hypothetical protein KKI24_14315 [bacterium]|nr:hypothetical protein [bacterium]
MALDKATLKTAIENGLASAHGQGLQAADSTLAQVIADAVDAFVKSGTVSTAVTVTVDPGTHAGGGTGTGSVS